MVTGTTSDFRFPTSGGSRAVVAIAALTLASIAPPRVAGAQEAAIGVARGTVVRPFAATDLDGQPVDLAGVIGRRPVLVEFWASWCTNCEALAPLLAAAHARYGTRAEFLVVAVGVNQSRGSVRRHLAQHPLPGRVLWDGDGAAVRALQAPATSYVVVLDAAGRVAYTGLGPEQDVEAALRAVVR
jgi:thiol-disulfide isomerase/thioredoxin